MNFIIEDKKYTIMFVYTYKRYIKISSRYIIYKEIISYIYVRYFITKFKILTFTIFKTWIKRQRITYEAKRDIIQITNKLNYPSVGILNSVLIDKLRISIKKFSLLILNKINKN